jgi:sporadic carbohydrate cluster protein (TIGR04323 family)
MQRAGYRGYIGSRPYRGQRTPQHVQNLVVRSYCQRNRMTYLLSATEYAMPGCYIILNEVLVELPQIEGIVLYSLFMLPEEAARRHAVWDRVLAAGATIHGAVEDWAVRTIADRDRAEDLWLVAAAMRFPVEPALLLASAGKEGEASG